MRTFTVLVNKDDCDFYGEDQNELKEMLPIIKQVFREWNLFVNDSKTEYTRIHIAKFANLNNHIVKVHKRKAWRKNVSLGSKTVHEC